MIIDFFTGIGCWPFRKLKHNTVHQLINLLGREGIDRAVLHSVSSILAKDCMEGNIEVAEAAAAYSSRFIPFACINPNFPGWKSDFTTCFEKMGFRGLRLFPTYHGYDLGGSCFSDIAIAAEGKQIPVILTVRVEDERQHHWLVKVPPLDIKTVVKGIADSPKVTFVLSGATYPELISVKQPLQQYDNWYFDIARMHGRHDNPGPIEVIIRAIDDFGARRILFGSNAPFQYIKSSLMKVQYASVSESDRDLILSGNAKRLLGPREE
jgi:predicted TIM-barrel fold metal-dependent hydrolase